MAKRGGVCTVSGLGAALVVIAGPLLFVASLVAPATAQVAIEAQLGVWSEVGSWNFIPIHASILEDGRVMTYGGKRNGRQGGYELDIWDPDLGLGAEAHSSIANNLGSNLFCSIALDDPNQNRTLMLGGTQSGRGPRPSFTASFDGSTIESFESMNNSRWYPTATTLWDGRILVQGGVVNGGPADTPVRVAEVHTEGQGWKTLEGTRNAGVWATPNYGWWYPKSYVTPAGKIWNLAWDQMFYLDPEGAGSVTELGTFPTRNVGATSASVMFDTGLVLQVGGGERGSDEQRWEASNDATVIDLNYDPPGIRAAANMNFKRHWANAIALPDGRVLVIGGSRVNNSNTGAALNPEIWDPLTDTWTILAANEIPRLYHSTALLLPDGTIYSGGGGEPGPRNNLNGEVFYPPYLYEDDGQRASQPEITSAPGSISYDQQFTVEANSPVDRVTLIKSGNNTHGMSTQIFQELPFTQSGDRLEIESPDFATVATPGRYMLFVLDADGVPSKGKIMNLSGTGLPPPQPHQLPPNLLTNGSFEQPDLPSDAGYEVMNTPGWQSNNTFGNLELWNAGHSKTGAADGGQLAELNVAGPVTISQDVSATPGATYRWSFEHRGRKDNDTIEVLINGSVEATVTNAPGAWRTEGGTFTAPEGSSTLQFGLRAVDKGGAGNLIDDVRLELVEESPPTDGVELTGLVTEHDSNSPVSGMIIELFSEGRSAWLDSTRTREDGTYQFTIPADNCYTIIFVAPNGRRLMAESTNNGQYQNRNICAQNRTSTDITSQLAGGDFAASTAEGVVSDSAGGGVGGATVDLFRANSDGSRGTYFSSARTNAFGNYEFELPTPGCYIHTVESPDDRTFTETGTRFLNLAYCADPSETLVLGDSQVLNDDR